MSGPNISQYFSNNPPSLFDEIAVKNNSGKLALVYLRFKVCYFGMKF